MSLTRQTAVDHDSTGEKTKGNKLQSHHPQSPDLEQKIVTDKKATIIAKPGWQSIPEDTKSKLKQATNQAMKPPKKLSLNDRGRGCGRGRGRQSSRDPHANEDTIDLKNNQFETLMAQDDDNETSQDFDTGLTHTDHNHTEHHTDNNTSNKDRNSKIDDDNKNIQALQDELQITETTAQA